jgi:multidrug resistance efflux pump
MAKTSTLSGRIKLIIIVALAAAAVIAGGGCRKKATPPAFTTMKVKNGTIIQEIPAAGTIVPERRVNIQSERGGIVNAVRVKAGDPVKKGQPIIELRDEELKMQVMRAETQVSQYTARLQELKDQPKKLDLITAESRVEEARRKAEHAKQSLDRTTGLHEQGYRSDAELDQAELDSELADQEYKTARDYLEELKKGATAQEIEAARSELKNAETELQIAKESLSKAYIYAPISGIVLRKKVEVGDAVSPGTSQGGTSLLEIADVGTLYFEGNLDQTDAASIHVGQPAAIKVDALPNRKFTGRVTRVAPAAEAGGSSAYRFSNENTVSFPVKVEITGGKSGLMTGMRADVKIEVKRFKHVLLIPLLAVKYENDSEGVFLPPKAKGGTPVFTRIKTGIDDGKSIVVEKGLKAGQEICGNYSPAQVQEEPK